jgi:hypothetical protein
MEENRLPSFTHAWHCLLAANWPGPPARMWSNSIATCFAILAICQGVGYTTPGYAAVLCCSRMTCLMPDPMESMCKECERCPSTI